MHRTLARPRSIQCTASCRATNRRGVWPSVHRPKACVARASSSANSNVAEEVKSSPVTFQHLLLTILDADEYLSDGSRQALATAALLAQKDAGRVTVLVIEEPGKTTPRSPDKQIENISWHLRNQGLDAFQVVQRSTTDPASVLIGDVADEIDADLCVVSSQAVHSKYVDLSQLSEFIACPFLVLPL